MPPSEFVMSIPYSAEKDDLYHPAQHAVFFPAGRRKSDAALCVLAALKVVCCRFHRTQSGSGDGETVGELAHARLPLPLPLSTGRRPRIRGDAQGPGQASVRGLFRHRHRCPTEELWLPPPGRALLH